MAGSEDPFQRQACLIIERQVGQLSRLVDDLLEVSRFTSGRVHLQLERTDLRSLVERAVESARPLIDRRKHILNIDLPGQPIWINADPTRIEQVIVNLLNNASKFTDDGGQIWVGARPHGAFAVLIVRDTGVGISPDQIPHLFDLFSQGERSLDRAQGGLGIGLSLVKRLSELHGGTATARSEGIGKGSEFTVSLPLSDPPSSSLPAQVPATTESNARAMKILVVDDNFDSTTALKILFSKLGYEVKDAYTGPTALQIAAEFLPDAILLDIGLPGLNGFEVARRIRRDPNLAQVFLIAMSGYGQETDLELSRQAGFDDHLVKPMPFEKVRDLLAQRFESRETKTAPPGP